MTRALQNTFAVVLMFGMYIMVFMALFTPEKTASGQYVKPFQYWTSQQYYCDNFNPHYCRRM